MISNDLHRSSIVIDTHNDFISKALHYGYDLSDSDPKRMQTDLKRMQEGGMDVQFFSIWSEGSEEAAFLTAMKQIDALKTMIAAHPSDLVQAYSSKEMMQYVEAGKIAILLGVEGGHMIENDLTKLDRLYEEGVRYLTLTHNISPEWVSSCVDENEYPDSDKGLTDFGISVIRKMNDLGMMIDVSHLGEKSFWQVLDFSSKPIFASHSCVAAICPNPRNLTDEQIIAIAENEGIIQVNFFSLFLESDFETKFENFKTRHKEEFDSLIAEGMDEYEATEKLCISYASEVEVFQPDLSSLIDHIDHIVDLVGVEYVGLGSDFDGAFSFPKELDDVSDYPKITEALVARNYSKEDIRKILGANLIRYMQLNELP